MATGVEELVDMLFAMIDEAKSVPLSSEKCIIERDKALDLLDDIKAQFPMELGEAKKLLAARADYIASAKREAELIRKQAEEKARQMLAEDELLAQAKRSPMRWSRWRRTAAGSCAGPPTSTVRTPFGVPKRPSARHTTRSSAPARGSRAAAAGVQQPVAGTGAVAPGGRTVYDAAADEN